MNPAFSVIFFTTASGAGYGLLGLLGAGAFFSFLPADRTLMISGSVTALVLITGGLLSSTFHLGHPERAWRAVTQWRTSWLSREGVCALLTYIPATLFVYAWAFLDVDNSAIRLSGLASVVLALITVFTTAMIYASLRSIHAWNNKWVPLNYLLLALATGLILLNAFLAWLGVDATRLTLVAIGVLAGSLSAKLLYWRFIDSSSSNSSNASAIGSAIGSTVKLTQSPHSQPNYLQQEMVFVIARKHAHKLRRISVVMTFVIPSLLLAATLYLNPNFTIVATTLTVPVATVGILIERWLFFAEAKHTVALYYNAQSA
ncbi:MAG: DMSO reductase anchor subunit [Gammaproteobacteria bacterium]